jgi:YVTN family beta-propeller protein
MRPPDLLRPGRWWRRVSRRGAILPVSVGLVIVSVTAAFGARAILEHAGPQGDGTAITSYGWHVTPAGRQTTLGERPYGMALSPDGRWLVVSNDGVAVAPNGRSVWVTGNLTNTVSVLDVGSGAERRIALSPRTCPVDSRGFDPSQGRDCLFPYTVVFSADGRTAYVSNWGQDSVLVVDTASGRVRGSVRVGTHPSAMSLSPSGNELYVAVTDGDAIAVVNPASNRLIRTFSVSPYPGARVGAQPNALVASPDGRTLYAANAGNNDVDVIRLATGGQRDRVLGHIPTGWYPAAVAVAPNGRRLFVANARGLGAGPNPRGPDPEENPETTPDQYIGSMIKGTLSTVDVPDTATLQRYTRQVIDNNGFAEAGGVRLVSDHQHVVPRRVGQRSPIKHVIYVVNESRTYDQVLGDLGRGNGDPSITLFGRDVAPNHPGWRSSSPRSTTSTPWARSLTTAGSGRPPPAPTRWTPRASRPITAGVATSTPARTRPLSSSSTRRSGRASRARAARCPRHASAPPGPSPTATGTEPPARGPRRPWRAHGRQLPAISSRGVRT